MSKRSGYLRAASRFLHLALGAKAEDEEEERERAEDESEDEEEAREEREDEEGEKGKKGKKAKKGKAPCSEENEEEARADEEDGDGDEDEDENEEEERKNDRKAASEARAGERARWAAVMSSKVAAGRIPLACSLLTDTDMNAEKICAALAASPTESRQGLAARMAAIPRPDVGASAPVGAPDPTTPKGRAAAMMAAYAKARGESDAG